MARAVRLRVPASSANLGPGFDVLALALDLQLWVSGREAAQTRIRWLGEGSREVPLDETNLIVRAAQEPFRGWARPLEGLELSVGSKIPIGRGLGSSAAAIAAGVLLGALSWPSAWLGVLLVPAAVSPTEQARRLVPERPERADAIFNMARVAEWVIACGRRNGGLLASAMQDRLHQPGRRQAYPYLDDVIAAALRAGALGAALSGAGGSVLAVVDRKAVSVGRAMAEAARQHKIGARILRMGAATRGAG